MKSLSTVLLALLSVACLVTSALAQTRLYRLPASTRTVPDYFLADGIGSFENGPAPVEVFGHSLYVDRKGQVIAPRRGSPAFDEARDFGANGLAVVRIAGKFGYIDRTGGWVVRPELEEAESFWDQPHAVARKDGKFGVFAADGGELIPFVHESGEALYGHGFLLFDGEAWAIADRKGELLTPFHFDALGNQLSRVSEGLIPAKRDGLWGLASAETGEWVVPARYDSIGRVSEGRVNFVLGDKIGYLDRDGRVVVEPRFESADEFSEGLAAVRIDGRWGYIDKQGEFAIAPSFDRARKFRQGHAPVVRDGEYLTINRSGEVVPAPPDEPRTDEPEPDAAVVVDQPQRAKVRFEHLNLGVSLWWDGKGAATEVRVFRLDTDQTLVWDARLIDGRVHAGLFLVDGKIVVLASDAGFRMDRLEEEVAEALRARQKALQIIYANVPSEARMRAAATLSAIQTELKVVRDLEKTYFDRRHEIDLDASNETDAAANRITKARPYVDRLKGVSANIDHAIAELSALSDEQRRLLAKIRDDAAEIAQQVLRLK